MNKQIKEILDKTQAVICSATINQKKATTRYVCFANKRINELLKTETDETQTWQAIDARLNLKKLYENKFGTFIPMAKGNKND